MRAAAPRVRLRPGVLAAALAWATAGAAAPQQGGLEYLAQTDVPTGTVFAGTVVGGLSGLDYDAATDSFVSETDHDERGRSRVYTLKPVFLAGQPGFRLAFTGVADLGPGDAESIRHDPGGDGLWFTTEGRPPGIHHRGADGRLTDIAPPADIAARAGANTGLEGLTFTPGGALVVAVEDALAGDAPDLTRIAKLGTDGTPQAQWAYRLDTLPGIADRPSLLDRTNNGVSEILAVDDTRFLVLERAWDGTSATTPPAGVSHNSIRIYRVDTAGAHDVTGVDALPETTQALRKVPVFDSATLAGTLDTYATKVDNIEGMSFGPRLPDGRRSLVLVSDNNNSRSQGKTQFLVFAVADPAAAPP